MAQGEFGHRLDIENLTGEILVSLILIGDAGGSLGSAEGGDDFVDQPVSIGSQDHMHV